MVFAIFFCSVQRSLADDVGRGGFAGAFLRMGLGARAMGMGGGSVALSDDGYVTYYNPAGLVFLPGRWFTANLNTMALDRKLIYVGYAQSMGRQKEGLLQGGFSAGWLCAGVDDIDGRDFNGNDIGSFSNWEHCFFFSFALNPVPPLAIGISGKLLYNRFPGILDEGDALTAVGFGFDIGILIRPIRRVTLGLTIRDLRSRYTWDSQDLYERGTQTVDRFPRIVRGGAAVHVMPKRLMVVFDLEKIEYFPLGYHAGVEFCPYRGLSIRGGIRNGALTFGGGYRQEISGKVIHLDYAYVPDSVAPRGNHIFSWSFVF